MASSADAVHLKNFYILISELEDFALAPEKKVESSSEYSKI